MEPRCSALRRTFVVDLNELIIRQDGVLTTSQAQAAGLSRSAVSRRRASGEWTAVAPSVYLVSGHLRSARAQARIAVLSVGEDAVLGGVAACWWHRLHLKEPAKHHVFTGRHGRHARSSATAVVRHRDLADEDVTVVDDLRITTPALSVLDAAGVLGIGVLDSALLSKDLTLADLRSAHERYPNRRGAGPVSRYLDQLEDGTRSEAERRTALLFRDADIDGWTANVPVCGYLLDFVFLRSRLAVEIDGFAFHRDADTFQRDRTKRNALVADGWTVLNFTWADLTERPEHVVEAVRSALLRAAS